MIKIQIYHAFHYCIMYISFWHHMKKDHIGCVKQEDVDQPVYVSMEGSEASLLLSPLKSIK